MAERKSQVRPKMGYGTGVSSQIDMTICHIPWAPSLMNCQIAVKALYLYQEVIHFQ
jgi:hypothetical protein